jgi:HEAT repeat protein
VSATRAAACAIALGVAAWAAQGGVVLASARADERVPRSWRGALTVARARSALDGERVTDESERVAAVALTEALPEAGSASLTLRESLAREQSPRVREALMRALVRRARPESVEAFAERLARGDAVERGLAARGLAAVGNDAAVRALVRGLAAPDAATTVAPMLVRVGPVVVPRLLRALAEPATSVVAAQALGALGDARATAALVAQLGSTREPERVAAVEALAALGDARAADAVAMRLDDGAPRVVLGALRALAVLGDASHADALLARTRRGESEQRRAALAALVGAEPHAAAARMAEVFAEADPVLLGTARTLLLEARHPAFAALLEARVPGDAQPEVLASALGALSGGAGVPALTRLAAKPELAVRRSVAGPLAVALHRWDATLSSEGADEGRAALALACASLPGPEAGVLRALAREVAVVPLLREALRDPAPDAAASRAAAALAVEALGEPELAEVVRSALLRETDAEAFRRLADAARSLGVTVPVPPLLARVDDPETGPESLELAASSLAVASPAERRAFAVRARRALRARDERLRAAAALALGVARDGRSARALLAATRDDSASVAVAAARALAALPAPPGLADEIAAEARAVETPALHGALRDAHAAATSGRAMPMQLHGEQVLHLRLALADVTQDGGVGLDVRLADGRLQRRRTLPGGALYVPDLPAGIADITLRVDAASTP